MDAPRELEPVPAMTWQRAAIRDQKLKGRSVPVVAALTSLAPGRPLPGRRKAESLDFYASVPVLMQLSRLGDRAVRLALDDMIQAGYLLKVKRGGRHGHTAQATVWRMVLPPVPNAAAGAGWGAVDNHPETVDNQFPNRHEEVSQPAPADSPRAFNTKSVIHHPLGALRTERARGLDADDDGGEPEPLGSLLSQGTIPW